MLNERYRELLRNQNLKSTKHRNSILQELERHVYPLSAEAIFLRLKEKGISISLSTVYRTLETLAKKGVVIKISIPDENKCIYELNHEDHHHHLVCVKCKKMLQVDGCPLEDYEKALADRFDFSIKGHNLEVFGLCSGCQNQKNHDE